jgi:hypothetical protein
MAKVKMAQHCKLKSCKAYRELPVSQFSQGETCFHYREPLFSLQGPCFHYRDFPVNPCTSLLGIAVKLLICKCENNLPFANVKKCPLRGQIQFKLLYGFVIYVPAGL